MQDLYRAIGLQYQEASALLQSKDALLKGLQRELEEKDKAYVVLLSQHQEDIVAIVRRMQEQVCTICTTQTQTHSHTGR